MVYDGLVKGYDFEMQKKNYDLMEAALKESGMTFKYISSARFPGDIGTNHRFVCVSKDGSVVWHKYVAHSAQGGQNHIFVGGIKCKVSTFLSISNEKRRALLSNDRVIINLVFIPEEYQEINNAPRV